MSELEHGDILDIYKQIGKDIIGYEVVEPWLVDPDMTGSYNHNLCHECPNCGSGNTCCIRYEGQFDWYCKDCWLAWRAVQIGEAPDSCR